jgi:hypothetical protein
MLSTELEYIFTELECFLGGWHAFDSVGIHLYRAGIPLYRVEMLSRGLECFRQSCDNFVQSWKAF